MADAQRLLLCVYLFALVHVRCALFTWLRAEPAVRLVDQATVVAGNYLYISGGAVYYTKHYPGIFYNHTLRIDLTDHWNNSTVSPDILPGHRSQYGSQSLFYSPSSHELYTFGGFIRFKAVSGPGPPLDVFKLDQPDAGWSLAPSQPPAGVTSTNAGLYARTPDSFYNLGGQINFHNNSYYDYSGLVQYSTVSQTWANISTTGYNYGWGAYGIGLYVPYFGEQGVLVFLGGQAPRHQLFQTNPNPVQNFSRVNVYDIARRKFLFQTATTATGSFPTGGNGYCMVGVHDPVAGGYDIFVYGGQPYAYPISPAVDANIKSVWVLSLPSFQWTQISGSETSQPRAFHSCETIGKRQMVVVGGYDPKGKYIESIQDDWMDGLGIFDMSALRWTASYNPKAASYERPQVLVQNAGRTPFPAQWQNDEVKRLFHHTLITSTGPPAHKNTSSGSATNVGAIAGGVVGGIAALALIALGIWYLRRRNRQSAARRAGRVQEMHADPLRAELPVEPSHGELRGSDAACELPTSATATAAGMAFPEKSDYETNGAAELPG